MCRFDFQCQTIHFTSIFLFPTQRRSRHWGLALPPPVQPLPSLRPFTFFHPPQHLLCSLMVFSEAPATEPLFLLQTIQHAMLLPSRGAKNADLPSGSSWGRPPGLLRSQSQGFWPQKGVEALNPRSHCFGVGCFVPTASLRPWPGCSYGWWNLFALFAQVPTTK